MRSLLWKEWLEQRWRLGFGCLLPALFAWIGLYTRVVADEMIVELVCAIAIVLLPVLAATGLLPTERGEGTLQTLLSLPIEPWKIQVAKTAVGALLCVGPLIVSAAVAFGIAGDREMAHSAMFGLFVRTAAVALSMFLWMLIAGVRVPSEARAALVALGILIIWGILAGALVKNEELRSSAGGSILAAACPFAFLFIGRRDLQWSLLPLTLIEQALILSVLWLVSIRQLARSAEDRS